MFNNVSKTLLIILTIFTIRISGYPEPYCPEHEAYTDCVIACNDCIMRGNCDQFVCYPGCDCIYGFFRNSYGICVPAHECEAACPSNEEYSLCAIPCDDCRVRGRCQFLKCKEGCNCISGYFRNKDGVCIPEEYCPSYNACKEYEEFYECIPTCKNTCDNYYKDEPCVYYCKSGCYCRTGLVKNIFGLCVEPRFCPPPVCGINEEFSRCVIPCNTCASRATCEYFICNPGCDCKQGYFRNNSQICVPEDKCPKYLCPKNEIYTDCISPCNTCTDRGNCTLYDCYSGCDCVSGFYRNESGICVSESQCLIKPKPYCDPDEELYVCKPDCQNTCDNFFKPYVKCSETCQPGCFCKQGLVKNRHGKCIPPSKCEYDGKLCGPDEQYYYCLPSCNNSCENFFKPNVSCVASCISGCSCRSGLLKNKKGKCVFPHECENQCEPDEKIYTCIPDCEKTCKKINNPDLHCLQICKTGCFCKEGLVKRKDGKCVVPDACNHYCKPDEQFYNCKPDCKNICINYNQPNASCSKICSPGCFCKAGLVKRADGVCVEPKHCPACKHNEQFYNCMPDCKNTCANYGQSNTSCTKKCEQGCFCKSGLVKRSDGECVIPKNCIICPPDERYDECHLDCRTCKNYNQSLIQCPMTCMSGCFCKDGLVRRSDGKCVVPKDCDVCKENEQYYACTPQCKLTCENYLRPRITCPLPVACQPGCFCKAGLVQRHDGVCIQPKDCPTGCKHDEHFYICKPNCTRTCAYLKRPFQKCPEICTPGCFCKAGLVKTSDGRCVEPKNCPICKSVKPCIPPLVNIFGRSGSNETFEEETTENLITTPKTKVEKKNDDSDVLSPSGKLNSTLPKNPNTSVTERVTLKPNTSTKSRAVSENLKTTPAIFLSKPTQNIQTMENSKTEVEQKNSTLSISTPIRSATQSTKLEKPKKDTTLRSFTTLSKSKTALTKTSSATTPISKTNFGRSAKNVVVLLNTLKKENTTSSNSKKTTNSISTKPTLNMPTTKSTRTEKPNENISSVPSETTSKSTSVTTETISTASVPPDSIPTSTISTTTQNGPVTTIANTLENTTPRTTVTANKMQETTSTPTVSGKIVESITESSNSKEELTNEGENSPTMLIITEATVNE